MKMLIIATTLSSVLIAASVSRAASNVSITADNAYMVNSGDSEGMNPAPMAVYNTTAEEIHSCSTGPEFYADIPVGEYLYIAAWSDSLVRQGVLAQFLTPSFDPIYSGDPRWEVCATGVSGGPDPDTVNAQIAECNLGTGGTTYSQGWVDFGGGPTGTVGTLAFGEPNLDDSGMPGFPGACPNPPNASANSISIDAVWMWYNPDGRLDPFIDPKPPGEFLIFRLNRAGSYKSVPTLSEWGKILLVVSMLTSSLLLIRRSNRPDFPR